MPAAHRHGDNRTCSATTTVIGQSTVKVNGKLWAVKDDTNTHSGGGLINSGTTVFIEGKPVIVVGDQAKVDGQGHSGGADAAASGSGNVFAYGQ